MPLAPFRQPMILLATVVSLFYLYYRAFFTLNLTTPYATFASLFLLLAEGFGILVLLLYFLQIWDPREPEPAPPIPGHTVDVFVPTYNEDVLILRATLEACVRMDYPHRTFVLDDGRRPEVEALAKELGVEYITRPDNKHAKAGNLNHAFARTDGEFVVIFDADHVPDPNFITRTIGHFADEKLGFVQTPHAFYNFDSFQALLNHEQRKYWEEGHLFYCVIQPGRNRWKCPIFAGSAAIFRRKALADAGYIATETITEDMHTGLRMHAKGWTSLAVGERLVAGQAAPDITTFHSQRLRWGEGNLSIMHYDNPLFMRGLTPAQRLSYFGSMIHWASGLFKLAIYLTPILMLFTGIPPVHEFTWLLAVVTGTYLFVTLFTIMYASAGYGSIVNAELFSMMNFWTQIRATFRAVFWRRFQRFVVTSKRGRQSKSVWPYIMPHVILIGVSLLALFWGWSRLAFGISDDFLKPVIPTCWVLFHMLLANMVIRRAFWPEDRRYTTRHVVHVPVSYETVGQQTALPRFGVSVDLNESGVGLVAYEQLAVDSKIRLTIRAASEVVECDAVVRTATRLSRGPVQGFRYGCKFVDLTTPQIDAINRICLHYAVPRLYRQYARGNRQTIWQSLKDARTWAFSRRQSQRFPYRLPILLNSGGAPDAVTYAVTEDLSREAASALLDRPIPPGTEVEFLMPTPINYVLGRAKVLRDDRQELAAKDYHRCVLQFEHFEEQGRTTLNTLLNPRENTAFTPVLTADKKPMPVSVARPVVFGSLIAVPLILMELGVFQFIYHDELFLRNVLAGRVVPGAETAQRVDAIYAETMAERYPSTDRLVLLMSVLNQKGNRPGEVNEVAKKLAPRDRRNSDLQMAMLYAQDQAQNYAEAEATYQQLLRLEKGGRLPAYQRKDLYVAGARSAVHSGNLELAVERFDQALALDPADMKTRNEYAGVLVRAKKFPEAEALYASVQPDVEARKLLVYAYAQSGRYAEAERQADLILANDRDDPDVQLLLAEVLQARRDYERANEIYLKLLKQHPRDPDLRLKMAQISLGANRYNDALDRLQPLLDDDNLAPDVVGAYVDAANGADSLGEPQRRAAVRIFDRVRGNPGGDPIFLARLAWFLERVKESDKSALLLDQALALNPKDPTVRNQLAGSLMGAGRWEEAAKLLEGENNLDARFLMLSVRLHRGEYDKAEQEARQLIERLPRDRNRDRLFEAQKLLAVALICQRKSKEAVPILEELRRQRPEDAEVVARLADAHLAAGDYAQALAIYEQLLGQRFDQPKLWAGFIDAASGSPGTLTEEQANLAVKIFERYDAARSQDVLSLSRFAWVLYRLDRHEQADKLLDRAVALKPTKPEARKELAGVLAVMERYPEAIGMYEGLPNLDAEDKLRLAGVYTAAGEYKKASQAARDVINEDPKNLKARLTLATILAAEQRFKDAIAEYDRIAKEFPKEVNQANVQELLAAVTLANRDFQRALERYQTLLTANFEQPRLWPLFIDAASSAPSLSEENKQTAVQVYDRLIDTPVKRPELLSRLAWVMYRVDPDDKKQERANKVLDRALELKPASAPARRELAGVLAALHRNEAALAMYEGIELTVEDRLSRASIYARKDDLARAEKEARELFKEHPNNPAVMMMLADVLSWNKTDDRAKFKEATDLYTKLRELNPKDLDVEVKLANVALWGRDYDAALERFHAVLEQVGPRKDLWSSYVDAMASATKVGPKHREMLARFGDRLAEQRWGDPIYLGRLAYVWGRVNDRARSVRLFSRALELSPKSTSIRLQYAQTLYSFGDFDAAERQYAELIRQAPELATKLRRPAAP